MNKQVNKKIKCKECKRIKHPIKDDTYFIRWYKGTHTCEDCINVAYYQIKLDRANQRRAK